MESKLEQYNEDELQIMFNTMKDNTLQNEKNRYWFVCFDKELQVELIEYFNNNNDVNR